MQWMRKRIKKFDNWQIFSNQLHLHTNNKRCIKFDDWLIWCLLADRIRRCRIASLEHAVTYPTTRLRRTAILRRVSNSSSAVGWPTWRHATSKSFKSLIQERPTTTRNWRSFAANILRWLFHLPFIIKVVINLYYSFERSRDLSSVKKQLVSINHSLIKRNYSKFLLENAKLFRNKPAHIYALVALIFHLLNNSLDIQFISWVIIPFRSQLPPQFYNGRVDNGCTIVDGRCGFVSSFIHTWFCRWFQHRWSTTAGSGGKRATCTARRPTFRTRSSHYSSTTKTSSPHRPPTTGAAKAKKVICAISEQQRAHRHTHTE